METLRENEQVQEQTSRTWTRLPSRHPSALLFRPLEDKGNEPPETERRGLPKQKSTAPIVLPAEHAVQQSDSPDPFRWRNRLMTLLVDKLPT